LLLESINICFSAPVLTDTTVVQPQMSDLLSLGCEQEIVDHCVLAVGLVIRGVQQRVRVGGVLPPVGHEQEDALVVDFFGGLQVGTAVLVDQ